RKQPIDNIESKRRIGFHSLPKTTTGIIYPRTTRNDPNRPSVAGMIEDIWLVSVTVKYGLDATRLNEREDFRRVRAQKKRGVEASHLGRHQVVMKKRNNSAPRAATH